MPFPPASPETLTAALAEHGYIANPRLAMAVHLARALEKPLLVEGPPGVGKTALAATVARALSLPMVRLQCHEGLDETRAVSEWKYSKQLLYTQLLRERLSTLCPADASLADAFSALQGMDDLLFSEAFLEPRPLLKALQSSDGCVLLIDEIDKADAAFEAFLLEVLEEFQITLPEIGTLRAKHRPVVFLTSNDTRELGDALRRRCLHVHIPFPDLALESSIVAARVPALSAQLRTQVVSFVQKLRELPLRKHPAVSETIDWARALIALHIDVLDADLVRATLDVLLKHEQDVVHVTEHLAQLTVASSR